MAIKNVSERKAFLNFIMKLAKKPHEYKISGKHNRKSLEKTLANTTSRYNELKSEIGEAEGKFSKLQEFIDNGKNELKMARKDILDCHDILRNMDFAGASGVRVGKDNSDVAYACDGKWMHYDTESGEKQPYSKWKKSKSDQSDSPDDSNESDDVSDANDDINNTDALDPDGVDITV